MEKLESNFTGTGWKFPIEFREDRKTVVMLTGEEDIRNSLEVLFSTRIGERIMHANYGSALPTFLFMTVNRGTLTYMQAVLYDEILFNEPRIIINNLEIKVNENDPARLDISLDYKITATNNRYNYVYPFYIKEATNLSR